jgi:general secretion pathway protein D
VRDLTGQVTVIADPTTNSLIVVSLPENAELIKAILAQLDKIPQQVMIETIIVEATLDASDQFGVEWNYVQNNMGGKGNTGSFQQTYGLQTTTTPPTGFKFTMTGSNLTAFLNVLKTDTKFQVLSTPRIFTANNSEAQINISQQIPYVLSTLQDVNGNLSYNYGYLNVGIVLTVLPRITSDGYVAMDITQTANDLQGYTTFNAPIVNQREATTSVAVKDGETIILGGIIRNQVNSTVNKIPLLGDIPFLGNLFKTTSHDKQRTELLVFLTPRVIRSPEEAKKLFEDSKNQMSDETKKSFNSVAPMPAVKGGAQSQTDGKPKGGS